MVHRGDGVLPQSLILSWTTCCSKSSAGRVRCAPRARPFGLGVDLIRQLLGYLLPDQDDTLCGAAVGVYAARFGLLWTMPTG